MDQLRAAIEAGLEKVTKNTELLLEAPLVFLLLTHPVHGPNVLRAVLAVLHSIGNEEEGEALFDIDDFSTEEDKYFEAGTEMMEEIEGLSWATYNYAPDSMPEGMRPFFDILIDDPENVLTFWHQLGLQRAKVRKDLMKLSRDDGSSRKSSKVPLADFKKEYPVLFDLLNSNFGNMASNQRIVEMLHSFVRSFYNAQQPIEFLESKLRYMMDQEFTDREERRNEEKDRRDPDQEFRQIKHLDTKAKCLLQGEQMRKWSEPYTRKEIARLAPDIQQEIKLRKLKKRGTTEAEKDYQARLDVALEKKLRKKASKGRNKRLDFATQQKKADKVQTDYNRD